MTDQAHRVEEVAAEIHDRLTVAGHRKSSPGAIMVSVSDLRSWRDRLRIAAELDLE